MGEILVKLPQYAEFIAQALGGLAVVATVIVRITPSEADNAVVKKYSTMILKVISYLPTIGLNPKTKKLEEAYKVLKDEDKK